MERASTMNRNNTYLLKEFFKLIVIAPTQERAELAAQWLVNNKNPVRGVYGCAYNKSQMIVFYRWPSTVIKQATTAAVEALLLFVDNAEEFYLICPEIQKYGSIPVRVIVSESGEELQEKAKELHGTFFKKEEDSTSLKAELDVLDKKELKVIKKAFTDFDSDNSGSIEADEMRKIALSLGENPDTEEFKQSMLALDFNGDNNISFTEFVSWWKIGRQNTITLPKIYQLNEFSKKIVNLINFAQFVKQISGIPKEDADKSTQNIYFRSPGIFKLKTFLELGLAIGGPKKTQMGIDFLSQFTKNTSSVKNNWISILVNLNNKQKLDINKAKEMLEQFKENVLKWGEENANPVLISFVKNLMLFETSSNENAVILVLRLKLDIEELVKGAIQQFLFIINSLSKKDDSFWFNMKTHSNLDLMENVRGGKKITLGDYFKTSELKFEGSGFRNRLKALFESFSKEHQSMFHLFQFLFLPQDLDLEFDGDLNDLVDQETHKLLNVSLDKFGFVMDFLNKNLNHELLSAANNIEIGINAFDIFANLKFYSQSVFSKHHDVNNDMAA